MRAVHLAGGRSPARVRSSARVLESRTLSMPALLGSRRTLARSLNPLRASPHAARCCTPPSMHLSALHILCICGGCTSECQKGATSARARSSAHGLASGRQRGGQRAPSHSRSRRHPWLLPRYAPARMHTSVRREPSSAAIESARDSSTRALERTRPGERPPARGTARTIPRFSSMTPPSMHSSSLRILCICGTGCTSECQKNRLQHARRSTHTVTGGSPAAAFTWTRCVVRRDDSRACTTPVDRQSSAEETSASEKLCLA